MPHFSASVEGEADLRRNWRRSTTVLRNDLAKDTHRAARAGVRASKDTHSYQDRTGDLTGTSTVEIVTINGDASALMQWPMSYASYVNQGTQRSRPYPFTPHAERTAEALLEDRARFRVTSFIVSLL